MQKCIGRSRAMFVALFCRLRRLCGFLFGMCRVWFIACPPPLSREALRLRQAFDFVNAIVPDVLFKLNTISDGFC